MTAAVSLIENEAVLTLAAREPPPVRPRVRADADLAAYFHRGRHPYTTAAPAKSLAPLLRPALVLRDSLKSAIAAPAAVAPSRRLARIRAEMVRCGTHPHPNFSVFPVEDDIGIWRVLLQGPHGTPYAGGLYELVVHFPVEYPMLPPEAS
jgi:Ubiquitin-conjugating enzyme